MLEQRTIEILAQVVYKEKCQDKRNGLTEAEFWAVIKKDTLALAQAINEVTDFLSPKGQEKPDPQFAPRPVEGKKWPEKIVGATCTQCNAAPYVKNPKTGKVYCSQKCWL